MSIWATRPDGTREDERIVRTINWIEEAKLNLEEIGGDPHHVQAIFDTMHSLGHDVSWQDYADGVYRMYGDQL